MDISRSIPRQLIDTGTLFPPAFYFYFYFLFFFYYCYYLYFSFVSETNPDALRGRCSQKQTIATPACLEVR